MTKNNLLQKLKGLFIDMEIDRLKLVLFIITFLVYLMLFSRLFSPVLFNRIPTGDEPHYLLLAHSIINDGDLDLRNNYQNGDYGSFYSDSSNLDPQVTVSSEGKWYSIHDIGLSLLILPAYALWGYKGAALLMVLFTSLLAVNVFLFSYEVTLDRGASFFSWAVFSFTTPILFYSSLIFPEILGALGVVYALRMIYKGTGGTNQSAMSGLYLSLLPWLHLKYAVLVFILSGIFIMRNGFRKNLLLFFIPIFISAVGMIIYNLDIFHRIIPDHHYIQKERFDFTLPIGLLGLFFDQEFGLLFYAPIYLFSLAGIIYVWREQKRNILFLLLPPFLAVYLISGFYKLWWGGWCPPCRYLVPILPILAVFLTFSYFYPRKGLFNRSFKFLGFLTAAITIFLILKPGLLYNQHDGRSLMLFKIEKATAIDFSVYFPSYSGGPASHNIVNILWLIVSVGFVYFLIQTIKTKAGRLNASERNL